MLFRSHQALLGLRPRGGTSYGTSCAARAVNDGFGTEPELWYSAIPLGRVTEIRPLRLASRGRQKGIDLAVYASGPRFFTYWNRIKAQHRRMTISHIAIAQRPASNGEPNVTVTGMERHSRR